ncbi:MAG: sigma 54-interacting transcriptional regulator [Desulforhopalus sp.]
MAKSRKPPHRAPLEGSRKALSIEQQLNVLNLIFDHIDNGACVVDPDGYITHFNNPYANFLGVDAEAQIDKHVTDVIEGSRMHIVAKTGKAEINASHPINGQNMVVQRIPVKEKGKVIAVYGQVMFKNIKEVSSLAAKLSELKSKVKYYQQELSSLRSTRFSFESIIHQSQDISNLIKEARRASLTQLPVLITGESGTGKELFAQAIHNGSTRYSEPFIRLNCAAIPKDLLEAELFGYDQGAFTGAKTGGKPGKFELAHRGSIFLDEIGDLPLEMQPKLLRVLEEREFERIGGNRIIKTDFRLIAASNQNLKQMVADGAFRSDLYYRLNVIPLEIPPLRQRQIDIIPLARHLLQQISIGSTGRDMQFSSAAESILKQHSWPGNVRELSNVIERTFAVMDEEVIHPHDLPLYLHQGTKAKGATNSSLLKDVVIKAEKSAIQNALKITNYSKVKAAMILGIHRTLLYKKARKYGISLSPK